ncbi:M10 family metallopeptidase [Sphingomonas lenta]|uniref:Peptidase metallopeptidase domain-containing protein n=1 Tax=Sphingomonas lenta TaxID=1141887 RepID=A0A2A2SGX1_9SPHN|nr:M10 family metallopeptidase [Sphingomonas lenta]PAX08496.1 hypothetical protein CKY28_03665 [Sphingomonas lenta]
MREFRSYNQPGASGDANVHYGAAGAGGTAFQIGVTPSAGVIGVGTTDDVANDRTTTATLAVGGERISTLETLGDKDFFKVQLEAGRSYEIGMFGQVAGPNGIPLVDSYIEVYDAAGNKIGEADGGASTQINTVNSGFDAILQLTAASSGTYYIAARAFDNAAQDGSNDGDLVGDYRLTLDDTTGQPVYKPYYDPTTSPLHALDWGSQVNKVHQSVRNPDGAEGPRPTGNAAGTPTVNPDAPDGAQTFNITGKNVITVYFAKLGEVYVDSDPTSVGTTDTIVAKGLEQFEKDAFEAAFASIEKVADIDFRVVDGVYDPLAQDAAADFVFVTYTGTPRTGLLGRMSPPDEDNEGQAEFNALGPGWDAQNLVPGGFSYVTLIHEMGHGLGMAHPHDNGGRSSIMRGVVAEGTAFDYTTGDFNLNQGVFTMMSYEDGWVESPYGNASTSAGYGYNKGPMAFDIAVLQDKYGVNEETARGNDTYRLADANQRGTGFESIWDAAGVDQIVYDGLKDASIDLRAATLKYEVGGGGRVSYVEGIFGGFTVANGVTIENASSGAGADRIVGNAANNNLSGNAGSDLLIGGAGVDTLLGGIGNDWLEGGAGADTLTGGTGSDVFFFDKDLAAGRDRISDFAADDFIVTTVAFRDGNRDNIITANTNKVFDFTQGGSVAVVANGKAVTSLRYDGTYTEDGVQYFVYSLGGGNSLADFTSRPGQYDFL